jgi:shikimate kinase
VLADLTPRHVVLVGAMGAGKTSIGRRVADALGIPLADGDDALVARYGETARDMADTIGADELHRRETTIARALLDAPGPTVVGPAASVVDDAAMRTRLREELVVWLRAGPELLAARAVAKPHRPFLDGPDAIERFVARERARAPRYAEIADLTIDVSNKSKQARDAEAKVIVEAWNQIRENEIRA